MAKRKRENTLAEALDLFEKESRKFVPALRKVTDAERLGAFAKRWLDDPRPFARSAMIEYLEQPLNAFRHEVVVKRLFKTAEERGDDELMGCFLVAFDRALRHVQKTRRRYFYETFDSRKKAQAQASKWLAEGCDPPSMSEWSGQVYMSASKQEEYVAKPNDTMPRPEGDRARRVHQVYDYQRRWYERCRLFTLQTRRYLRRRAWRYFRNLGKHHPERYVEAISFALRRYRDGDVSDELALLDCWGLMHALFHHSDALTCPARGWKYALGKTFADVQPAPYFPELWEQAPAHLFDLAKSAKSRPVRLWAIVMFLHHGKDFVQQVSIDELFALLESPHPEVVAFGADLLRSDERLQSIAADRWLALLQTNEPQTLEVLCELMSVHLHADRITLQEAIDVAKARPLPVARLGFDLLRAKSFASTEEVEALLQLAEASSEMLRPEMVHWVRETVSQSPHFQKTWVLDFLDSRFDDVRAEGWSWFQGDDALANDPELWQKLLESPYDDVKLKLIENLRQRTETSEPSLIRFLWASVLVNIHRGGRSKPTVVRQIVDRLHRHPSEANDLLPLLAVALRSVRGPEFRTGLAGVVQLLERCPELEPTVVARFPELSCEGE